MANVNTGNPTLDGSVKTEYERRLLGRALPRLAHGRYSTVARMGKFGTYELRRYESLSAVTSTLTEGATPAEQASPSLTVLTVSPSFYGAWLEHTDVMDMEAFDPIISEISGILGEQCGLSMDTIIRNALTDGATKDYSGGESARTDLAANVDIFTYQDILRQVAQLWAANAQGVDGDRFAIIMHPYDWATIMQDTVFANLFIQEAGKGESALRSGLVGSILNANVYLTSNARSYVDGGAANADVYSMLFIGRDAYGTVGIGNTVPNISDSGSGEYSNNTGKAVKPVQIIVKQVGSSGALDPLDQRGTVAWKASLGMTMLQSTWIRDLEHINVMS